MREPGPTQSVVIASPAIEDVVAALRALDQRRHTELTVEDTAGAYIAVGGGLGVFHVYVGALDHEDRVVLQRPRAGGEGSAPVELMVDGRSRSFAPEDVVDEETALAAVREFMAAGRPHPDLEWRTG
ncbi:Imm1 family immunity protein [Asanoa sp. WMMD1127]|uniref:Imm1 family immunity protein n=1 Tax=Asanoa sp. WMMD1127 TaxID=3016107 RepID=UPI00241672C7|nr:Imm1 family immunity protein [Asanoa sp. WMMD1127]MDG4825381.1 Imm1 family immunity protein [Asanoa sp. WMMD1127]